MQFNPPIHSKFIETWVCIVLSSLPLRLQIMEIFWQTDIFSSYIMLITFNTLDQLQSLEIY